MQFSIVSVVALAATASASYISPNGTATSAYYPTGTAAPTHTSAMPTKSTLPFTGGASRMAGSAFGLIVAGGVAFVSLNCLDYICDQLANTHPDALNAF